MSPALAGEFFTTSATWEAPIHIYPLLYFLIKQVGVSVALFCELFQQIMEPSEEQVMGSSDLWLSNKSCE